MNELIPVQTRSLPPILAGAEAPAIRVAVENFYSSVAAIFEAWVKRRESPNTQRAYREDVMAFVGWMGWTWPKDSMALLGVTVSDVHAYRDWMRDGGLAPKTMNRRISSLSGFYKFLAGVAAEKRLPIMIGNPAHAQFIGRGSTEARDETKALTAARARQLMSMPSGDSVLAARDRAIVKFFLYTGARLGTGCRLKVSDFHRDGEESTIRLHEKGNKRRTIGLHYLAAEALQEYIEKAEITGGPLFRPQRNSRVEELANRLMDEITLWRVILRYVKRLPGAMKEVHLADGTVREQCVYTPHSLRATTATLLLDAGKDITKVQELLGHRHVTTTQIYDKRRRSTSESASHDVPI